jgi:hypothetical protein
LDLGRWNGKVLEIEEKSWQFLTFSSAKLPLKATRFLGKLLWATTLFTRVATNALVLTPKFSM